MSTDNQAAGNRMTGAEIVLKALKDNGVEHIFGYPGGAVLPIYDEIFQQDDIKHILVRHEQGAGHAAEGYARSTGKVGVMLVTSGPGATNAVTPLQDALMDLIPLVCLTGQVPTSLIGSDAFQECDTVGITRPCTKHNWLVKDVNELAAVIHEAFRIAQSGRPGPVVVDIPKDVQFATGTYTPPADYPVQKSYQPKIQGDLNQIHAAIELMASARRPVIYSGGGVVNSGPEASKLLRELVELTDFPITSTLMGLGAYPASGKNWLKMLGMHGSYEANMAMHDCDVMVCIGARFDDRITGRLNAFSPNSKRSTSISIRLRSTRTSVSISASAATSAMSSKTWFACGGRCRGSRRKTASRIGGATSPAGGRATPSPIRRTATSSCRNMRWNGCLRIPRTATPTSRPRSGSTRCGRRSSSASNSRTAG